MIELFSISNLSSLRQYFPQAYQAYNTSRWLEILSDDMPEEIILAVFIHSFILEQEIAAILRLFQIIKIDQYGRYQDYHDLMIFLTNYYSNIYIKLLNRYCYLQLHLPEDFINQILRIANQLQIYPVQIFSYLGLNDFTDLIYFSDQQFNLLEQRLQDLRSD